MKKQNALKLVLLILIVGNSTQCGEMFRKLKTAYYKIKEKAQTAAYTSRNIY